MYINIFKIVLKNKINLKVNFLIKILNKLRINIDSKFTLLSIFIIFNYISSILVALGLNYILSGINQKAVLFIIFLVIILSQFFIGMTEYKKSFVSMFEGLKVMSLATDKKLYNTLLGANLLYHLILNIQIFLSVNMFFFTLGFNLQSIIYSINSVILAIISYIYGNMITGKYVYNKVMKRISTLRLSVYILFSGFTWYISFNILNKLIFYINKIVLKNMNLYKSILSDSLWENISKDIEMKFYDFLNQIEYNLVNYFDNINLIIYIVILIILIFILIKIKINLIPQDNNINFDWKKDIFYMYYKLITKISNLKGDKDILYKYQIREFFRYRWLFANNFFQLFFINYEAICYIGIFTALIINSHNNILILQLMICMNLMVLANQSFELRVNSYIYFSITKEKLKLEFFNMALFDINKLFEIKLKSFRIIYIFPVVVMILYSSIVGIISRLSMVHIFIILIMNIILFFIMSLIQMHIVPIVANFDYIGESQIGESYEEEELANKLQEIPRLFLVVFPMILTFLMICIPSIRLNIVIYIELIYLIICSSILYKYMIMIIRTGMKKLYEKVYI